MATTAQAPNCRLEGEVVDPKARPVANAAISIQRDGVTIASTRTDGSGRFVMGHVPRVALTVRATAAGPYVGACEVDLALVAASFARLRLMPARRLTGQVFDPEGQVVAAAWVATAPTGDALLDAFGTACHTDAEGRFVFDHVPFGPNALRVWAAGYAGIAQEVLGASDVDIACHLEAEDPQERNFQLRDATPAQRASAVLEVTAMHDGVRIPLPSELARPTMHEDGWWRVHGWPYVDRIHARPFLPGAGCDPSETSVTADVPDRSKFFDVVTTEQGVVRGRLVVRDGALPAGGVELAIRSVGHRPEGPWRLFRTDARGSFAIASPVAPGSHFELRSVDPDLVLARNGPRFLAEMLDEVVGYRDKHTVDRVLEPVLVAANCVTGSVRRADGAPVPGARIHVLAWGGEMIRIQPVAMRMQTAVSFGSCESRLDGTFELRGLELREGDDLVCQVSGPGGYLEHAIAAAAGRVQDVGVLTVGDSATLRGKVETAAGQSVPGARIRIENYRGTTQVLCVSADRDGSFVVMGLMPGQAAVGLVGQRQSYQAVDLEAGAAREVTLK